MEGIIWVMIVIAVLVILFGIIAIIAAQKKPKKVDGKYPEGHFMGTGIAMGIPIGIPIGLALGNIAIGPAIGVAIGAAIGAAMEKKAREEGKIRPLTKEEKDSQRRKLSWALAIGCLVFLVAVVFFFLLNK